MPDPSPPSPDDELLLILLRNLRNATSTFGPDAPALREIRSTIEQHLREMRARGITTNLAQAREFLSFSSSSLPAAAAPVTTDMEVAPLAFTNLVLRPKPSSTAASS